MVTGRASGSSTGSSLPCTSAVRQLVMDMMRDGLNKLEKDESEARHSGVQGSATTTPAMHMQPEALSAKAPASPTTSASPAAPACFPPGIYSMEEWSRSVLLAGKFEGQTYGYIDNRADNEKDSECIKYRNYRKRILNNASPSRHSVLLMDYKAYLLHRKQMYEETIEKRPLIPGTSVPRVLRQPDSSA
jgi:hypothetical protein